MAKVESVKCSSNFYSNNSSFPELKFGLEDCSPKCDFDIGSFLCDNETRLKKQYIDNDNRNDSKNGRSSPLTSLKTESLKLTSLSTLAENHAKKSKMLPELSFDGDFSLSDLLCNDDCQKSAESVAVCESGEGENFLGFLLTEDHNPSVGKTLISKNDDLFDFLVTEDDNPNVEKTSGAKNDISFDDLSQWMNSSTAQTSDSFKLPHTDNFSRDGTKGKLENTSSVSLQIETKDTDKSESTNTISNVDLVNLLREVSIDSSETTDSLDATGSSETNSKEHESTDEISDDDFLRDVDLTFCIKKNSKKDFSFYGNSPDTVDSGFDESDFVPDKLSSPSEGNFFYKGILISPIGAGNKNVKIGKVKQSLFSRAISAKPKIDDSRKLRLKNVMKELLKGSTPLFCCDPHINLKESQRTIDHTNEHVIVSSYLKFGDEK